MGEEKCIVFYYKISTVCLYHCPAIIIIVIIIVIIVIRYHHHWIQCSRNALRVPPAVTWLTVYRRSEVLFELPIQEMLHELPES